MKVRSLTGALLAGGTLALGPALAVPASAAPYPPTPCAGQTGILNASLTLTRVGGTVHFFACGFIPARSVVIMINGIAIQTAISSGDGSIDFTWTFTYAQIGLARVQVVGPAASPTGGTTPAALTGAGSVRTVAASTPTRVLATTVRVLPRTVAVGSGGGPAGGLPVSGGEAGALGALAVVLTGGGVGLRARARRRAAAGDGSEE